MTSTLPTLLFRALAHLPLALLHNIGALLGWAAWGLSPSYRRKFRAQIEQAGLREVRFGAIAEAGKSALELPKIWLSPQSEIVNMVVRISGKEVLEAAQAAGKGILFLTPHLGCFEISAQYYAAERPITVLYRRSRFAWLEALIQSGRGANVKLAPADLSGVRRLLKALRNGEAVGMLPDQVPGNGEGIWVPFFGRPAYTMTLAARLAASGATVVMAYAERLPYGAGYQLNFLPLVEAPVDGIEARTAQLNREVEHVIRQCPQQYLWGYNRYKAPAGVAHPSC